MKRQLNILSSLKQIYPLFFTLLLMYPSIVAYIIDYTLVIDRYILINFIWIPIITIPFILTKKKIILYIFSILFFVTGLIEVFHWLIIKGPITVNSLLVMSNTNFEETLDFFDLMASYHLLLIIPFVIVFYFNLKHIQKKDIEHKNLKIIIVVALVSIIFISENYLNGRLVRKGLPYSFNVGSSFIEQINTYKDALKSPEPRIIEASSSVDSGNQTFVLIIGESLNRNHMSLYGYNKKTSPELENRTDIKVFDNVVSPYSTTLKSILSILSESNLEKPVDLNESIDIIDVFHSANFETYWISNQSPFGIWDNLITFFAKKSDHFNFVNLSSNSSFEATLNVSYDEKVLKPFQKVLQKNDENKLIIIHLMGNHSNYAKRYPSDYNLFQGDSEKEQTIAEYDNSVLYNDFIVDSIINLLKFESQNISSSLIYLSDHSENVYDENNTVGHGYSGSLPKSNVEIPFIVWLSDEYKNINPDRVNLIDSNLSLPFISDDLFHCIIDLNNINADLFKKSRSIFNTSFNSKRKRILVDKKDYDLK